MSEEKEKKVKTRPLPKEPWIFYNVSFKLFRPMYGAVSLGSISADHMKTKAKKEIAKINRLAKKVQKLDVQHDISASKELLEAQGALRAFQEMLGKKDPLPENIEECIAIAGEYELEFQERAEDARMTVFLQDPNGRPMLSTHIVLGNQKEILRAMKETGHHGFITSSKTGCDRVMAMDIKPVEEFMFPSMDILRNEDGTPLISERIIFYEDMGTKKPCIGRSQVLPEGTTFGCTLRCRNGSPISEEENLIRLFECGKNLGFGPHRGSGNKGAYLFKIEKSSYTQPLDPEGYR